MGVIELSDSTYLKNCLMLLFFFKSYLVCVQNFLTIFILDYLQDFRNHEENTYDNKTSLL